MENEMIKGLRDALQYSPDNVPLKLYLVDALLKYNQLAEAEMHLKQVLEIENDNAKAKYGLADLYYRQSKYSTAAVILEELCQADEPAKKHLVLYAKALLKENANAEALKCYQQVLEIDPTFTDDELDAIFRAPMGAAGGDADNAIDADAMRFIEKPDINFDNVGGMNRVKDEIDLKIIKPLQHADLYAAYGKKTGGGILLYGPPGCGKTHLARATAGQVDAKFISIGINDVLDMWIGSSERNLHEIFEVARRNTPCVLFFDEVDALGASRSDMKQATGRHLINQFLSELDGIGANNDGILILAATNAPWHVDPAFRRPGRFDRIIFVEPPDAVGRVGIMKILLNGKPTSDIDYNAIGKLTPEFSGADLKAVVDICIEEKLRESFKTSIPTPISTRDLTDAVKKHKPSTKEWFNTARNYALYANDAGLYDDILDYLKIKK